MLSRLTPRLGYLLGAVACAAILAAALYLQIVEDQQPCPLCILQRVVFAGIMVLFLVAAIHNPARRGAQVYAALIAIVAGIGVAIAGRHVWLQNLPKDKVPACGPDLSFMLEQFPLSRTLELVLKGSGECAEAGWKMFGLTIPEMALVGYLILAVFGIVLAGKARRR